MHPALHLDALNRLVPSIRRYATLACKEGASVKTVKRVRDLLVERSDLPTSQTNAFLPVFFHHLDPRLIPPVEALEARDSLASDAISRALFSLNGLAYLFDLPLDVGPFLWPSLWSWIRFLMSYWDYLPKPPANLSAVGVNFITTLGLFQDHEETWKLISNTPGFRNVMAQIWKLLPTVGKSHREAVFRVFSDLIAELDVREPANLDEFIAGAGGSPDDLAKVIIQYMHLLTEGISTVMPDSRAVGISCLITFIQEADDYPGDDDAWLREEFSPLCVRILLNNGLEALLATIHALMKTPDAQTGTAIVPCMSLATRFIISPFAFRSLVHGLQAGLLRIILNSRLRYIIVAGIPMGLVFHDVVVALEAALSDIDNLTSTVAFRKSPLFQDWKTFIKLARHYIAVLDLEEFREPERVCNNLTCGITDKKSKFRRCSGYRCRSSYYCSSECQKTDWKTGGHRSACQSYGTLLLRESFSNMALSNTEREFLRALIHHHYATNIDFICAQQIGFIASNPNDVFLTYFDHRSSPLKIESEGRMQLHVIRIVRGAKYRHFIIPHHTADSELFDEMGKISVDNIYNANGDPTEAFALITDAALEAVHS
ncbi:hypothetical protein R3P38DRAFT_3037925 [Favolaschia claudopus]|uniref:MYND-type domain-containing protein n=1 Tax=Favolaschia claudopus TaxID=2862362 RepID=A0AAW0ABE3_9AGAR